MLKHLTAYLWEAQKAADQFSGADKDIAAGLINEIKVLKQRLSQSLSTQSL